MSKTPSRRPLDAVKTIQISAVTMVYLVSVPLQARMGFAENHPARGRNSTRSSKVKPLNYRLNGNNENVMRKGPEKGIMIVHTKERLICQDFTRKLTMRMPS